MKSCLKCGVELQDTWIACPNCGYWVGKPDHKVSDQRALRPKTPIRVMVLAGAVIGLLLLIPVAGGAYYWYKMSQLMNSMEGGGDDASTTTSTSSSDSTLSDSPTWQSVATFTTHAPYNTTTRPFTVGDTWKVSWSTNGSTRLVINAKPKDGDPVIPITNETASTTGSSKEYVAGDYSLQIKSSKPVKVFVSNYQ